MPAVASQTGKHPLFSPTSSVTGFIDFRMSLHSEFCVVLQSLLIMKEKNT